MLQLLKSDWIQNSPVFFSPIKLMQAKLFSRLILPYGIELDCQMKQLLIFTQQNFNQIWERSQWIWKKHYFL
uniref:Uncharacterized protein n=1 Tax=Meloidogyne incognita TaxID=6306 RepID=A0A914NRF3_MELIC